jgi:hypothetical protein
MYMKSGKVDGCGIRFIAVLIDPTLRGGRGVDGSINLWASGAAVVKGLSYDIDVAAMRSGTKAKRAQVERFWLKAPGQPATNPADGRFHNSDDEGAKLYGVKFDEGFELYKAAFEGALITIGVKRSNERGERLYFGKVDMSDGEKAQALSCLSELGK